MTFEKVERGEQRFSRFDTREARAELVVSHVGAARVDQTSLLMLARSACAALPFRVLPRTSTPLLRPLHARQLPYSCTPCVFLLYDAGTLFKLTGSRSSRTDFASPASFTLHLSPWAASRTNRSSRSSTVRLHSRSFCESISLRVADVSCAEYVNMTADELREWLETEDSQSSGWSKDNSGKVGRAEAIERVRAWARSLDPRLCAAILRPAHHSPSAGRVGSGVGRARVGAQDYRHPRAQPGQGPGAVHGRGPRAHAPRGELLQAAHGAGAAHGRREGARGARADKVVPQRASSIVFGLLICRIGRSLCFALLKFRCAWFTLDRTVLLTRSVCPVAQELGP